MCILLKKVYAAYHHFFEKYSGDPEFAVRAFLPLTIASLFAIIVTVIDPFIRVELFGYVNPRIVGVIFFFSVMISYLIELPKPRKNNFIMYSSLLIVVLFLSIPFIKMIF